MGYISQKEYGENIKKALDFLNGKYEHVIKMLEEKMYKASDEMRFEDAAAYRDLIKSVNETSKRQKITKDESMDRDIIAYAMEGNDAVVQVFFVRNGKVLGREHFHIELAPLATGREVMTNFIKQYYGGSPFIPKELLIQEEIDDLELVEKWLSIKRGSKVVVKNPQKGDKEKLVELAARNARIVLEQDIDKLRSEERKTRGAIAEIDGLLGLDYTKRIEAFDISNTNGFDSVGSMVVYEDGKPKRSDYRKFKIKTVTGPDDYASMREVLTRRFRHGLEEIEELKETSNGKEYSSFTRFPDLIIVEWLKMITTEQEVCILKIRKFLLILIVKDSD